MANKSVLELAVGTGSWDAGLKKAKQALDNFTQAQGGLQNALNADSDKMQQFVRMMGQMDSTAKTAKGQLNDYKGTIETLTMQYNRMTDAQKKTIGQDYLQAIDSMKQKYQAVNEELNDINKSINGGGGLTGALDNMLGKVGMNVEGLLKFGGAAGAATTALKVAKDAFFNSETSLDEWGRTVQASESLYSSFLSALNNSDISGFLSRMDEIVSAARDAYNAMDELGTFSAFQQRNVAKSRAGYAQALDEYRLNPTADNKQKLAQANQKVMNDLRESHDKTEAAYQAALRQIATERISGKGMQDAFVKMFSEGNYGDLQAAKSSYKTGRGLNSGAQYYYGNRVYDGRVQDRATGKWRDMSATEKQQFEFARALSQVNDSQIKEVQALGAQSVAITEQIYQQDRAYNRLAGNNAPLRGGGGSGGGGGRSGGGGNTEITYAADSIAAMEKEVQELTKLWKEAAAAVRDDYAAQLAEAKLRLDTLMGKNTGIAFDSDFAARQVGFTRGEGTAQTTGLGSISIAEQINEASQGLQGDKLKALQNLIKTGNDVQKSWAAASNAIGSIGSALAGIDDPAAKIIGIVGEAVANIALGFASASKLAGELGPFGWLAWLGAGTAALATTISTVHSLTGYAEGGVIKGNSFSGDNLLAQGPDGGLVGLNAGEVVLNRAQTGNLASQLQENGGGGAGRVVGVLRGEDIALVADRWGRRTGRGELAFFK